MMTSRFLGRFAKSGYDPQSEFSLPLWLNSLFELVMRIELGLIRCRIPLPLGGSRLIIAKKVKDL
jgi:hypothetical protein